MPGQRIRLNPTIVDDSGHPIDENQLAPITRMFLTALHTYGACGVENAGGFTFYAEDIHTAVLNLTDDEVDALIVQPRGTPLPAGKTRWQVVIEKLKPELKGNPFACGPWADGQDSAPAQVTSANFERHRPITQAVEPSDDLGKCKTTLEECVAPYGGFPPRFPSGV